jgi:hypothetical protein
VQTRRRSVAVLLAGGLLLATAGCSGGISTNGVQVDDPGQPLEVALSKLKDDNREGIQNNSITVSDATDCFYTKPAADAEDVTDQVACGPIRRLGKPDAQSWDTYRLEFAQPTDGPATATVRDVVEQAVAVDPALLVAPDGDLEPAAVDEVPAPQAPPTTVSNLAITLDSADGIGSFEPMAEPAKLITPAATVTVTEFAEPTFVPKILVEGQDEPVGEAPYYKPAPGQKVYAYKIKISASPESVVPAGTGPASKRISDLSTLLNFGIADGTTIDIVDQAGVTGSEAESASVSLGCAGGSGLDASGPFPCDAAQQREFVVLLTAPATGAPSLVATVDGAEQSVDLTTGELTSDVSQVEYQRTALIRKQDGRLEAGPATGTDALKDQVSASWSMNVDAAALTAFEPSRGWAPAGKAWLVVATSDFAEHGDYGDFVDDRVQSLTLTLDGAALKPHGVTHHEVSGTYAQDAKFVFEVPETVSTATLSFRPTGIFVGGEKETPFTVEKAAGYELTLPR